MKYVASFVIVVLSLVVTSVAQAGNSPSPTLDAVSTYIAGKPVTTYCENDYAEWDQFAASAMSPGWNLDGFTRPSAPIVYVSPTNCQSLLTQLRQPGAVGAYWFSKAVFALVHESVHQRGVVDEGLTDCTALPLIPDVLRRFFGYHDTMTVMVTRTVTRKLVKYVNGKRVTFRVRTSALVPTEMPDPSIGIVMTFANYWHRLRPIQYQGGC